jgi:hypothetical protein
MLYQAKIPQIPIYIVYIMLFLSFLPIFKTSFFYKKKIILLNEKMTPEEGRKSPGWDNENIPYIK